MLEILLAGSPNVGKTSLFNKMTKSFAHTGNWQGVTVDRLSKTISHGGIRLAVTDLPGLYSLTVYSPEEAVSRDALAIKDDRAVINVCDAGNLARNLYLTLQLLEAGKKIIIAVNMTDGLKKKGLVFEGKRIERMLESPVVAVSAKYGDGVDLLLNTALRAAKGAGGAKISETQANGRLFVPAFLPYLKALPLRQVWQIIKTCAVRAGLPPLYAAVKALENDEFVLSRLKLDGEQKKSIAALGDFQDAVASARYAFIDELIKGCVKEAGGENSGKNIGENIGEGINKESIIGKGIIAKGINRKGINRENPRQKNPTPCFLGCSPCAAAYKPCAKADTPCAKADTPCAKTDRAIPKMYRLNRIDKVLLNKYLALPVFLLIMLLIFIFTFYFPGRWLSQGLDALADRFLYAPIVKMINKSSAPAWVAGLVGDGIIKGAGGVLVFLPQVTLLFLFLSVLEDSGYISRVAFMTDGLFKKIGLSGRSAFTLLTGFGCSAAAVLSARALEDENMRKKTVLITPFMSCSARLPVYLLIVAHFFKGNPLIVFALYILGAAVALMLAAVFERTKRLKSREGSFVMEMPPYRFPSVSRAVKLIFHNVKSFLIRVGTVVFAFSVIIWLLSNFSFKGGFVAGRAGDGSNDSILAAVAGFIAPIFAPLGFASPQAATALLSGLAAKEIIISAIESLGGVAVLFSGPNPALSALSFLVFVLLYVPCFATLAAIAKEIGAGWAVFSFFLQTGVAYAAALIVYTVGLLFIMYTALAVTAFVLAFFAAVVVLLLRRYCKSRAKRKMRSCGVEEKA